MQEGKCSPGSSRLESLGLGKRRKGFLGWKGKPATLNRRKAWKRPGGLRPAVPRCSPHSEPKTKFLARRASELPSLGPNQKVSPTTSPSHLLFEGSKQRPCSSPQSLNPRAFPFSGARKSRCATLRGDCPASQRGLGRGRG